MNNICIFFLLIFHVLKFEIEFEYGLMSGGGWLIVGR